jgi:hypothetical protein
MLAKTETTEPRVANGINVDDLLGLIEGVRDYAARGNTQWRVTTVWQGQTRSRARVEGFLPRNRCSRATGLRQSELRCPHQG